MKRLKGEHWAQNQWAVWFQNSLRQRRDNSAHPFIMAGQPTPRGPRTPRRNRGVPYDQGLLTIDFP